MNTSTQRKLDALQADYTAEVSRPFEHFFCPVLYRDEDVELCQANIVNRAFRGSTKRWTIQRTDVDHFYGSIFESTFVQLRHKGKRRLDEFLTDKDLARHFSPTFTIGGKPVPHYFPTDKVPPSF